MKRICHCSELKFHFILSLVNIYWGELLCDALIKLLRYVLRMYLPRPILHNHPPFLKITNNLLGGHFNTAIPGFNNRIRHILQNIFNPYFVVGEFPNPNGFEDIAGYGRIL